MAVVKISPGVYRVVETEVATPASRAAGYAQTYSAHRWNQWELALQQAGAEYENAEERYAAERKLYAESLADLNKEIGDMYALKAKMERENTKADLQVKQHNDAERGRNSRHTSSQVNAAKRAAATSGRKEKKQAQPGTPAALTASIIGEATANNPFDAGAAVGEMRPQLQGSSFTDRTEDDMDDNTYQVFEQIVANFRESEGLSLPEAEATVFAQLDSTSQERVSRAKQKIRTAEEGAGYDAEGSGTRGVEAPDDLVFDEDELNELLRQRAALQAPEFEQPDLIQRAREINQEKFGPSLLGLARQAVSGQEAMPFEQRQNLQALTRFLDDSINREIMALGPNPTEAQVMFAREQGVAKAREAMSGGAVPPEAVAPVAPTPTPTNRVQQFRGSGGYVFEIDEAAGTITVVDGPDGRGVGQVFTEDSPGWGRVILDLKNNGVRVTPEPPAVDDVEFLDTPIEDIKRLPMASDFDVEGRPLDFETEPVGNVIAPESEKPTEPADQSLSIEEQEWLDRDTESTTPIQRDKRAKSRGVLGGRKLADKPRKVKRLTDRGAGATVKSLFESDRSSGVSHAQTQQKVIEQFQGPEQARMLELLMALRMLSDESKLATV